MTWHAQLDIRYTPEQERTVARHSHNGPLRVLQSLYPEGGAICHNVLVHPPGGLVGGDTLDMTVAASGNAHGLLTTPGATRFYRSAGELALQRTHIDLQDQARLEWLPLEALAYNQCRAENRLTLNLAPQAEFMGWDVTAFGLPSAALPFELGSFLQHIEVPGVWLERGRIDATDKRLMDGPLGLAGHRCMASLFFVSGSPLERHRREAGLELARSLLDAHALQASAGVSCPNPQVMVLRVLSPLVEPAMLLLRQVWVAWRAHFWQLPAVSPRIWST
ncbi:urease accessory protein UreD [Rhodoferax sp. U11-2br]|uniref:urease accessory protein UreD n=1 Tax=Rhodoferax sp. U11-2br TaxID=2838878 RepID=UPI001BEA4CA8|nr:urease accessory protein UreD [Rhodoferax sp. U11-2br]MBT3068988.1 urease accessory protein UreD [Rhodoferax sp. U11-2br]